MSVEATNSPANSEDSRQIIAQQLLDNLEAPLKAFNRLIMALPLIGIPVSSLAAKGWEQLHLIAGRQ